VVTGLSSRAHLSTIRQYWRATRQGSPVATRGIFVGIAAAATAVAGLAGCSSNNSTTSTNSSSNTSAPAAAAQKVVIDGQAQNVSGPVTCAQAGGNTNIGIGDPTNGIGAVVSSADPPVVQAVGLGNLTGVTLGYSAGAPNQGTVQATKNGKSYTVKGTATGVNMANPQQQLTKSFEMDVTCP
jgi:lipoprotein LpqH